MNPDIIAAYEEQSGRIFDPNGPDLKPCLKCGEWYQYESHQNVCAEKANAAYRAALLNDKGDPRL